MYLRIQIHAFYNYMFALKFFLDINFILNQT